MMHFFLFLFESCSADSYTRSLLGVYGKRKAYQDLQYKAVTALNLRALSEPFSVEWF